MTSPLFPADPDNNKWTWFDYEYCLQGPFATAEELLDSFHSGQLKAGLVRGEEGPGSGLASMLPIPGAGQNGAVEAHALLLGANYASPRTHVCNPCRRFSRFPAEVFCAGVGGSRLRFRVGNHKPARAPQTGCQAASSPLPTSRHPVQH